MIRTIAGPGYQFTGEIRMVSARPDAQATGGTPKPASTPSRPPTNLPEPVSELIGRDAAAQMAEALLRANGATRVIATSREPLRAEANGFTRYRLSLCRQKIAWIERTLCGMARLFVERARGLATLFA